MLTFDAGIFRLSHRRLHKFDKIVVGWLISGSAMDNRMDSATFEDSRIGGKIAVSSSDVVGGHQQELKMFMSRENNI